MIPSLSNYNKFLEQARDRIIPLDELDFRDLSKVKGLIIKHDVECCIDRAMDMAKVEERNGISSIWLFQRALLKKENLSKLKQLQKNGHLIGYHYDCLDESDGNLDRAKQIFFDTLDFLDLNGLNSRLVCPHGNPHKKRIGYSSNKDFYKLCPESFKNLFDLVMDWDKVFYSDYGYELWSIKRTENGEIKKLVSWIDIANVPGIGQLSLHSHRYRKSQLLAVLLYKRFHLFKKLYGLFSKFKMFDRLLNKFYFLLRRI